MSSPAILCLLELVQAGGSSPGMPGFWYGAGRVLAIVLVILVGAVEVAMWRAGGRRR